MQRLNLSLKTATKPDTNQSQPRGIVKKMIVVPPPKLTTRSYQATMSADRKEVLETIHGSSEKKHVLQLRLRTLKETKVVDASREEDIKTLEGEIKTLEDIIKAALTKVSP